MRTTASALSISALAAALLLAQPVFATDEELNDAQAQEYARDLLEPEEDRAGLGNIRDEPSDRYLEEKEENKMEGQPGKIPEEEY
ncbi:hypothetical protein [Halopseudomonas sp.]|uniref:hypothetical protein n=1 Tax=Halopseudomonas sp. TaxID=2901191 RepID=UPI003561C44B